MRRGFLLGALVLGALAGRGESAEPAPSPLWTALRDGAIATTVRSLGGADRTELTISNLTSGSLTLDVNGALILPVKEEPLPRTHEKNAPRTQARPFEQTQPLGVGLIEARRNDTTVPIQPGGRATVQLLTVCLNRSVSSPCEATPLTLAPAPAPDAAVAVLRDWRLHPDKDQGQIQGDVWNRAQPLYCFMSSRDIVVARRPAATGDPRTTERSADEVGLPADTSRAVVFGGNVAVVTSSGSLLLGKRGEAFRAIATDVKGIAGDRGYLHALLAKSPVSGAPALAWYDLETGAWKDELLVRGSGLAWARGNAAIVERDEKLVLVEAERQRVLARAPGTVVVDTSDGAALLVPEEGYGETRLVRVTWSLASCEVTSQHVNARLVAGCSLGGTFYALDGCSGDILRVRSSGTTLWLRGPAALGAAPLDGAETVRGLEASTDSLLVVTDRRTFLAKIGSPATEVTVPAGSSFLRDTATHELCSLAGLSLRRLCELEKQWENVRVDALAAR